MDTGTIITTVSSLLGVLIIGLVVPLFLVSRSERNRREDTAHQDRLHREDRDAEWARQDLVAEKAAQATHELAESQRVIADKAQQAANLLATAQAETNRRTDEVAELAAERDIVQSAKLDQIGAQAKRIHTLVNSDMTAARQAERDRAAEMAVVLRRVIALAESRGLEPEREDVEALDQAEKRGHQLDQILADRMQQMHAVDEEAARPGSIQIDDSAAAAAAAADDDTAGRGP